jgi:hypothetical protein
MRSSPPAATPMSAEVPPMSSVTTFSCPDRRPAQMPPISPATGPDMSRLTGRAVADSTLAMPPEDCMSRASWANPSARSASSKRAT